MQSFASCLFALTTVVITLPASGVETREAAQREVRSFVTEAPDSTPRWTSASNRGLPGETPLVEADFTNGLPAGWTATGLWHVTSSCADPGPCVAAPWAYFGDDASCTFEVGMQVAGALSTAPIDIPAGAASATLTYCSLYNGERGLAPNGYDSAWVAVNGTLLQDVSYRTQLAGVWVPRSVDLTAYAGQVVVIEWSFDSIDNINNGLLGWQVDGVVVSAAVADDCNSNGQDDSIDIAVGASDDCNTNGTPDECEDDHDCNFNSVPDECEGSGDLNLDCMVDDADFPGFLGCLSSPHDPYPPGSGCVYGDMDGDGDVDLADFQLLQLVVGTAPDYCSTPAGPCTVLGDTDDDRDVDLADFAVFSTLLVGPGGTPGASAPDGGTNLVDLDADGDVDLRDFWTFQQVFTG